MQIQEGKFEKNVCLVLCEVEQHRQSGMEWRISIVLCLLYKVHSVLFKILSLRNCLRLCLSVGAWCWTSCVVWWSWAWWSRTGAYKHNIIKTVEEPLAYKGIDAMNSVKRAGNLKAFMQWGNHSGTSGYQGCLDGQNPSHQHRKDYVLWRYHMAKILWKLWIIKIYLTSIYIYYAAFQSSG